MADVTKTTSTLALVAEFKDGDDRTITLDNPVGGLSATDINALNSLAEPVLVGDKDKAEFLRFKSAKKKVSTVTWLDVTPQG